MATKCVCDRCGKDRPSRDSSAVGSDVVVVAPWLTKDPWTLDDLCDGCRATIVRYIASIFRQTGKDEIKVVRANAVGVDGSPLVFDGGDDAAPDPAAPPLLTPTTPPPATTDFLTPAQAVELGMPPDDDERVDGTAGEGSDGQWYVWYDARWNGPRKSQAAAVKRYIAVREDREEAAKRKGA